MQPLAAYSLSTAYHRLDVPSCTQVELLAACQKRGLAVLSSAGAGAKADPTRLRIVDVGEASADPLARAVRHRWAWDGRAGGQARRHGRWCECRLERSVRAVGSTPAGTASQGGTGKNADPPPSPLQATQAAARLRHQRRRAHLAVDRKAPVRAAVPRRLGRQSAGLPGMCSSAEQGRAQGMWARCVALRWLPLLGPSPALASPLLRPPAPPTSLAPPPTLPPGKQVVPNFRVGTIPVLGTTPSIFGLAAASWILCQLAGQPYSPEPHFRIQVGAQVPAAGASPAPAWPAARHVHVRAFAAWRLAQRLCTECIATL